MEGKKKAVALNYGEDQKKGAPKIVAVGQGEIAQQILVKAQEHDVPIVCDIELVDKLVQLPLSSEIPPPLYEAVAKVLAFVYQLNHNPKGASRYK